MDCINVQIQSSSGSPQPTATVQSGSDEQPVQLDKIFVYKKLTMISSHQSNV